MKSVLRLACALLAALVGSAAPASGAGSALAMLDQLEPGRWEVRSREPGVAPQLMCLAGGHRLIQLRHPDLACDRFILQDTPTDVVVQYTCKGRGYGRTHIRRESGRLVQLDTRGIAFGLPFEFSAEGRRIGDCSAN